MSLNFMAAVTICSDFGAQENSLSLCSFFPHLFAMKCHVWLFATPWTVAHQATLTMGFCRQEYWSGLPFPSPGDLPNVVFFFLSPDFFIFFFLLPNPNILYSIIGTEMILRAEHCMRSFSCVTFHIFGEVSILVPGRSSQQCQGLDWE